MQRLLPAPVLQAKHIAMISRYVRRIKAEFLKIFLLSYFTENLFLFFIFGNDLYNSRETNSLQTSNIQFVISLQNQKTAVK